MPLGLTATPQFLTFLFGELSCLLCIAILIPGLTRAPSQQVSTLHLALSNSSSNSLGKRRDCSSVTGRKNPKLREVTRLGHGHTACKAWKGDLSHLPGLSKPVGGRLGRGTYRWEGRWDGGHRRPPSGSRAQRRRPLDSVLLAPPSQFPSSPTPAVCELPVSPALPRRLLPQPDRNRRSPAPA